MRELNDPRKMPIEFKYVACKHLLKFPKKYFEIFEYYYGMTDEKEHSFKECGEKFKINGNEARGIIAKVKQRVIKIVSDRTERFIKTGK